MLPAEIPPVLAADALATATPLRVVGNDRVSGTPMRWTVAPIPEWDGSLRWCRVDWEPCTEDGEAIEGVVPQSTVVTVAEAWTIAARTQARSA
jgi:hypothetical protein